MSDGRKKKRPGISEQQLIISQAAIELLLASASHEVTIAQICQHADVSRPTFYRCFDDKHALLEYIYSRAVNQAVLDFLPTELNELDVNGSDFKAAFESMYDQIFAQAKVAALLFREASDPNSPAYHIVDKSFERAANALLELITISDSPQINKLYFKSLMAANQWLVHDAINKGLKPKHIKEAKAAGWALVVNLLA